MLLADPNKVMNKPQDVATSPRREEKMQQTKEQQNNYMNSSENFAISKPRGIKTNISFSIDMPYDEICRNLTTVFDSNYSDACSELDIISDYLSVRDMRTIVRNLNLCDTSELFNYRKPALCVMIQSFLNQPFMIDLHEKLHSEETAAKIDFFLSNDSDGTKDGRQSPKNQSPVSTKLDCVKIKRVQNKVEVTKSKQFPDVESTDKVQKEKVVLTNYYKPLPPDPPKMIFPQIPAKSSLHSPYWDLSSRISDIEKAVSLLQLHVYQTETALERKETEYH